MIVLDTHVLYWSQTQGRKLSTRAAKIIEAEKSGGLAISAAVGLVSALLPSLRASRMSIAEALRYVG